jgi:hypothetical protein
MPNLPLNGGGTLEKINEGTPIKTLFLNKISGYFLEEKKKASLVHLSLLTTIILLAMPPIIQFPQCLLTHSTT